VVESPIAPRADLGYAANYLYMLTGQAEACPTAGTSHEHFVGQASARRRVRGLETYLNTVVDHGLKAAAQADVHLCAALPARPAQ